MEDELVYKLGEDPQLSEKDFKAWMTGLFIQQYPDWEHFNNAQAVKAIDLAEQIISFGKQYGLLNVNLK